MLLLRIRSSDQQHCLSLDGKEVYSSLELQEPVEVFVLKTPVGPSPKGPSPAKSADDPDLYASSKRRDEAIPSKRGEVFEIFAFNKRQNLTA